MLNLNNYKKFFFNFLIVIENGMSPIALKNSLEYALRQFLGSNRMSSSTFKELYAAEKESTLRDYFTFLRFASIATDPAYHQEVQGCAEWLCNYLKSIGLSVEKWETENAPVIFAYDLRAGAGKETLLLYCHYDVQPVDPLEEWITPPFEPTIREGEVYARGACDNKGQCFYTITAIKNLLKVHEHLPVNLKLIIEGEEESGSLSLAKLLKEKKRVLKADYLLIIDSGLEEANTPAITLGARGLVCLQASLKEAEFDLHSGMAGGIAYNPNRALVEMLSKLHDERGGVAIPGFYDDVVEISPQEKKEISFEFDQKRFQTQFGFAPSGMERGIPPYESCWLRPTVEINGMWGGYTGAGFKTVIPAKSYVKLSCRLVPDQIPGKIVELLTDFLVKNTPKGLQFHIEPLPGNGRGFRTNPNSRIAQLAAKSYAQIFHKPCKKILIGGSIPISVELCEAAEAEMVLIGVGLPDDHIHAPNEHFGLDRFEKGYLTICQTIELFE
jgi:acetylornithine deacetylase/succinyl-diaminopimelate desuccinylase-like protein